MPKRSPFVPFEPMRENGTGTGQQVVSMFLVTDAQELFKKLHFDVSLGGTAKFLGFGLGSDINADTLQETTLTEDSLCLLITAEYSFGKRYLPTGVKLDDTAQKLVDDGKWDQFIQAYGTHYIDSEMRSGHDSAILMVSNLSQHSKNQLFASHSGSFSGTIGVVALTAHDNENFTRFCDEAKKHGSVSLIFRAAGGAPLALPQLGSANITAGTVNPTTLDQIVNVLRQHSISLNQDTVPVEYSTLAPFSNYGEPLPEINNEQQKFFGTAFVRALQLEKQLKYCRQAKEKLQSVSLASDYYENKETMIISALNILNKAVDDVKTKKISPEKATLDNLTDLGLADPFLVNSIYLKARPKYFPKSGFLQSVDVNFDAKLAVPGVAQKVTARIIKKTANGVEVVSVDNDAITMNRNRQTVSGLIDPSLRVPSNTQDVRRPNTHKAAEALQKDVFNREYEVVVYTVLGDFVVGLGRADVSDVALEAPRPTQP